jgi:hypothetical protein
MLKLQAVRAVALLLPVTRDDSGGHHLLLAIVEALVNFTKYHSEECAQQVRASSFHIELLSCHFDWWKSVR